VRDNGTGIPPALLPHLFDLFVQSKRTLDRAQGGLGIGLTLVRHLVGLHGGTVEAQSEGPGKGSEFVVRLPATARQKEEAPPPAPPPASADGPRRILVIDDNVDGAEALAIVLRMAGHETRLAHSGAEALARADEFRPDVVFLDLGMPSMDGFEAGRQIRLRRHLDGTLLVAMTGYGQDAVRQRARAAGFDEYLVKPAIPEVIRALAQKSRSTPSA